MTDHDMSNRPEPCYPLGRLAVPQARIDCMVVDVAHAIRQRFVIHPTRTGQDTTRLLREETRRVLEQYLVGEGTE